MGDQLRQLAAVGQSIWLDNIRRSMFASRRAPAAHRSRPARDDVEPDDLRESDRQRVRLRRAAPHARRRERPDRDLRSARDPRHPQRLRPLCAGLGTDQGSRRLRLARSPADLGARHARNDRRRAAAVEAVDRPNVMIKIPGTPEGVPAIKASIAAGININVTLLFSVDRYEAAANAYIEGLQERASRGEPIDRIASVASVFVSRIDNAVDKILQAKIDKGDRKSNRCSAKRRSRAPS